MEILEQAKFTLTVFVICLLTACGDKPKTEHKILVTPPTDSYRNQVQCNLKTDTFSFKGFKIGMSLSGLKNLKRIKFKNTTQGTIQAPGIEVMRPSVDPTESVTGVESYEVTNSSSFSIFEHKIDKIYIRFYQDKLFEILIEPRASIVEELAKKLNASECVGGAKDKWIELSNASLNILCGSWGGYYELNVKDIETRGFLENQIEKEKKKKEVKKLNDF